MQEKHWQVFTRRRGCEARPTWRQVVGPEQSPPATAGTPRGTVASLICPIPLQSIQFALPHCG